MLKKGLLGVALCALIGGALWYMGLNAMFQKNTDELRLQATNSTEPMTAPGNSDTSAEHQRSVKSDNALHLALEAIDLIQGEGGFDLWRLKASYASIRQADGKIIVEKPVLAYYIDESQKDKPLVVISDTGEIEQEKRILHFIDNVKATYQGRTITGPILKYIDEEKIMQFPSSGHFTSPGMDGKADSITWSMQSRQISAQGNVHVSFIRMPKTE